MFNATFKAVGVVAGAIALAGSSLMLPGMTASADDGHTSYHFTSDRQGGIALYGSVDGAQITRVPKLMGVTTAGSRPWAYCVQMQVSSSGSGTFTPAATPVVANTGKVQWIIQHSYPAISDLKSLGALAGITNLNVAQAVAATQAAVWHYTDGFVLNVGTGGADLDAMFHKTNDVNVQKLYQYLVTQTGTASATSSTSVISFNGTAVGGTKVGPIHIGGVSGTTAAVSVTGGAFAFTYADGSAVDLAAVKAGSDIFFVAPATAGSVTINATAKSTTGQTGTVIVRPGQQAAVIIDAGGSAKTVISTIVINWSTGGTATTVVPVPTTGTDSSTVKPVPTTTIPVPTTTVPAPESTVTTKPGGTVTVTEQPSDTEVTKAPPATSVVTKAPQPTTTVTVVAGGTKGGKGDRLPETGGADAALLLLGLGGITGGGLLIRRRKH